MPLRTVVWHLNGRRVFEQRREPLVRFAALEPIEVVKTFSRRPTLVRTADAELVVGSVVPLAEGRRRVLIAPENLCDTCGFSRPLSVVTRKARRQFSNAPSVH